jgi:hypothetical protein
MKKIDELVANSLNPFTILHIKILQTPEELEALFVKAILEGNEIETIFKNVIEIDFSPSESIMFITKNDLTKVLSLFNRYDIKYEVRNFTKDLFEMDSLDELLSSLETDEDPEFTAEFFPGLLYPRQKAINIINSVFESNFSVDDVLDRINIKGSGSLNEFHKNLLK